MSDKEFFVNAFVIFVLMLMSIGSSIAILILAAKDKKIEELRAQLEAYRDSSRAADIAEFEAEILDNIQMRRALGLEEVEW